MVRKIIGALIGNPVLWPWTIFINYDILHKATEMMIMCSDRNMIVDFAEKQQSGSVTKTDISHNLFGLIELI